MDLKALDDFKVIAWAPYLICEIVDTSEEDKKLIISAAVEMLHGFVQARGNRVNPYWLDKVTDVAFKGFFDASTPYSIAKVGLYTSFKTAAKTSSTGKSAIKELALVHSAIEVARVLFGVVI
jgi:hypothetical protein